MNLPQIAHSQIVGLGGYPEPPMIEHILRLAGGRRVLFDRTASPQHHFTLDWDADVTYLSFYPWPPPTFGSSRSPTT